MQDFLQSLAWQQTERWLAQVDAWKNAHDVRNGPPNRVLGPDIQAWFRRGVEAMNACLQPESVHDFRNALLARKSSIDNVHAILVLQDLAWQPNTDSTECISGSTIWRMVIATMACRSQWNFGELATRGKMLTSFLGQWEPGASQDMALWHRGLCATTSWALHTTFDWVIEREAPETLEWVIQDHCIVTPHSMQRLVHLSIHRNTKEFQSRWQQIERLHPGLAQYITQFIDIHQQLTGLAPEDNLGDALAVAWNTRADTAQAMALTIPMEALDATS